MEDILKASHERSLNKCSENENEEEFTDYTDAPDIICESWVFSRADSTTMIIPCLSQREKVGQYENSQVY